MRQATRAEKQRRRRRRRSRREKTGNIRKAQEDQRHRHRLASGGRLRHGSTAPSLSSSQGCSNVRISRHLKTSQNISDAAVRSSRTGDLVAQRAQLVAVLARRRQRAVARRHPARHRPASASGTPPPPWALRRPESRTGTPEVATSEIIGISVSQMGAQNNPNAPAHVQRLRRRRQQEQYQQRRMRRRQRLLPHRRSKLWPRS
eukprot:SAG31_NODE_14752_length_789_cov_1.040580_1_plen_202_part_10